MLKTMKFAGIIPGAGFFGNKPNSYTVGFTSDFGGEWSVDLDIRQLEKLHEALDVIIKDFNTLEKTDLKYGPKE